MPATQEINDAEKKVDLRQTTAQALLTVLTDFANQGNVPSEADMVTALTKTGLVLAKAGGLKEKDPVVFIKYLDFFYDPRKLNSPYDPPVAIEAVTGKNDGSNISFTFTSTPLGLPSTKGLTCNLTGEERLAIVKEALERKELQLTQASGFFSTARVPKDYPFVVTGFSAPA